MENLHVARLQVLAAVIVMVAASATTHARKYTDLYNLGSKTGDPANPGWIGLFAQGRDGDLYSTTQSGGANGFGAVFQLTPAGKMTQLYRFQNKSDGASPNSGLTLGTDGNLYGTTPAGGGHGGWPSLPRSLRRLGLLRGRKIQLLVTPLADFSAEPTTRRKRTMP